MTGQYTQNDINEPLNWSSLQIQSYDSRSVPALVPAGTTATIQGLKIPGIVRLARLAWCGVVAPGGGETVTLRLFRIRPATNPAGFGFVQLASTFTISAANFPGPGVQLDFSDQITDGLCVFPGEYLACSWVHAGAAVMEPLNMNWSFTTFGAGPVVEPPATTTNVGSVFG